MPLPAALTRFNRDVANKVTKPFARQLPGFGVLQHKGRKSGTVYETPLNVFRDGDRLIVALTYGSDVDWLKNARASKSSEFIVAGETLEVGQPFEISTAEGMAAIPPIVRPALAALGVTEFVSFRLLNP